MISQIPSAPKSNRLHVVIFRLFHYKLEVGYVHIFKIVNNVLKVLSFNQLFLKLNLVHPNIRAFPHSLL